MTIETITAELTDFFADARPEVDEETISTMAEALHEEGLTLETASVDQLNALLRGESL